MEVFEIFPWDRNFETGIRAVDDQHKRLVEILNQLAAHLANRSSQVELDRIFDELAAYADYHFRTEEAIWERHFAADVWYRTHVATHERFIDQVGGLKRNESEKIYDDVIKEVVSFLTQWLAAHILESDLRMAKTVQALEEGFPLAEAKERANAHLSGSMRVLIQTVLKMYDSISLRSLELMREKALRRAAEQALFESEQKRRFLAEGRGEDVWDWQFDEGEDHFARAGADLFDIVHSRLVMDGAAGAIHPADIASVKAAFQAHLDGRTEFYVNKHRVLRKNGGWSWVLSKGKVICRDAEGNPLRMLGADTDITERELAALIYRHSDQAMFVTDVNNGVIAINPAFTRVTGYAEIDVIGKDPRILGSARIEPDIYQDMWCSLHATGQWCGELWNRRKDGRRYYASLTINTVTASDGEIDHYIGLISDITDRKEAQELILRQANYDSLTGLANRSLLQDLLSQQIHRAHHDGAKLALLFVDLDNFKEINDSYSHEAGDRLLKESARRMVECLSESDTVLRFGGDEFTIIVADVGDGTRVDAVVDRLLDELKRPFVIGDSTQVYSSASIGVTIYPTDAEDLDDLLKNADQAMYQAKRSGRGRFCYFTPAMQDAAVVRRKLLADMRRAIDQGHLRVHYQPIIELATGVVTKAEALVRWEHPERGMVMPVDFIPLAEESGLIVDIGNWVFQEVVGQVARWKAQIHPAFQVSINESPVQLRDRRNLDGWLGRLVSANLPGRHVAIEITEAVMMQEDRGIRDQLLDLRDAGVEVALDDFGTGYSSLAYLKDLHVDYIKIDRSFVRNLATGAREQALCEAMIVMAHRLGLKVVSEGVETEEHCRLLREMGCDFAQGFHFGRPAPASELELRFATTAVGR